MTWEADVPYFLTTFPLGFSAHKPPACPLHMPVANNLLVVWDLRVLMAGIVLPASHAL